MTPHLARLVAHRYQNGQRVYDMSKPAAKQTGKVFTPDPTPYVTFNHQEMGGLCQDRSRNDQAHATRIRLTSIQGMLTPRDRA